MVLALEKSVGDAPCINWSLRAICTVLHSPTPPLPGGRRSSPRDAEGLPGLSLARCP